VPADLENTSMSGPSPSYETDPRVDDYIDRLPDWQQAICRELRNLIHRADPDISETIKRTVQPYFVLQGNVCALLATKDHVNLFLYDGGIVPDPEGIITAGHENKTARMISFYRGDTSTPRPSPRCFSRSRPTTAPGDGASSSATAAAKANCEYRYRDSNRTDRNLDSQTLPANRRFRYSAEPPSWGR
jgi:hypothetical protein